MRSAPPLHIRIAGHGVWRTSVTLLCASACASMLAWWWAQPQPVSPAVSAAAALGGLASLACAAALWWMSPQHLRWDRQRWHVARGLAPERAGELAVAIDLGGWMLLRFVPEGPASAAAWRGRSTVWIALQRHGLEAQWHALRCALYAARPATLPGPEAASPEARRA